MMDPFDAEIRGEVATLRARVAELEAALRAIVDEEGEGVEPRYLIDIARAALAPAVPGGER